MTHTSVAPGRLWLATAIFAGFLLTAVASRAQLSFRLPLSFDPNTSDHCYRDHDPTSACLDWQGDTECHNTQPTCADDTYNGHTGTDFFADEETAILAAASGWIIDSDSDNGPGCGTCTPLNGNFVRLYHGNGVSTTYAHMLGGENVLPGGQKQYDFVECSELIGRVGMSGMAEGFHLHFGLKTDVDPSAPSSGSFVDPFNSQAESSWWTDQQDGSPSTQCSNQPWEFDDSDCVLTDAEIEVRPSAGGPCAGDCPRQRAGSAGRIVAGPLGSTAPDGMFRVWWQVQWQDGWNGWSPETSLGDAPCILQQRSHDGDLLPVGATTDASSVIMRATVRSRSGREVRLELEVKPSSEFFTGEQNYASQFVPSGQSVSVCVKELLQGTAYHWRARMVDTQGATDGWTSYGANYDSQTDFVIAPGAQQCMPCSASAALLGEAKIDGGCEAKLSVALAAIPISGAAPLNNVDLTASVSGGQSGPLTYTFYCDRSDDGTNVTSGYVARFVNVSTNPKLAADACDYAASGTYTPKVIVELDQESAEARATLTVGSSSSTCWLLTRSRSPSSGGTFPYYYTTPSSSPGCSTDSFREGEGIILRADSNEGWSISSWSGSIDDSSAAVLNGVIMPAGPHAVSVNYADASPTCYDLDRDHSGSGDDPDADPNSSPGCSNGDYVSGEIIRVEADPDSGWTVSGWDGTENDGSTSTTNTVRMPARDHTVTVDYDDIVQEEYELTIEVVGSGKGRVTTDPGPISCGNYPGGGTNCDHFYEEDTRVELETDPRDGSEFTAWEGDGDCENGVVYMRNDRNCTARFSTTNTTCRSLTLTAFGGGAVPSASPESSGSCPPGYYVADTIISLSGAVPDPGWRLVSWDETDNDSSTASSNSLRMPSHDETVLASYGRLDGQATVVTEEAGFNGSEATLTMNMVYNSNGLPGTVYFIYGPTGDYGNESPHFTRTASYQTRSHAYQAAVPLCGEALHIRAVVQTSAGTALGDNVLALADPCPEPLQAAFAPLQSTGTAPLSVQFTDQSTGPPTSWFWDFGDGTTSEIRHPLHVYRSTGTYTVRLRVANTSGSDTSVQRAAVVVTVSPAVRMPPRLNLETEAAAQEPVRVIRIFGAESGDALGTAIGTGDFDNDGLADLALGAPFHDGLGRADSGAVYVGAGIQLAAPSEVHDLGASGHGFLTLIGRGSADEFGRCVGFGDFNDDGIDDLLGGANRGNPDVVLDPGSADVLYGPRIVFPGSLLDLGSLPVDVASTLLRGDDAYEWFGATTTRGDLTGDGVDDIIIGSPFADPNKDDANEGEVMIFHGNEEVDQWAILESSIHGDHATVQGTWIAGSSPTSFGAALASGDVDGDGYGDLIASAPWTSPMGRSQAGTIYVFYGSEGWSAIEQHVVGAAPPAGLRATAILGNTFARASGLALASGDLNGDGYDEILIGASGTSPSLRDSFVVFGSSALGTAAYLDLDSAGSATRLRPAPGQDALLGALAACDLDGDGLDDAVVGVPGNSGVGMADAYVLYGSTTLASHPLIDLPSDANVSWLVNSDQSALLGSALACGDVDSDGVRDLAVGARAASPLGRTGAGVGFVVFPRQVESPSPVVSVVSTDATAAEFPADQGEFTFSRTGSTSEELLISYSVSGTASPGTDHSLASASLKFAPGISALSIPLIPIDDAIIEDTETVVVSVDPDPHYVVAEDEGTATAILASDDSAVNCPSVNVVSPHGGANWTKSEAHVIRWVAGPGCRNFSFRLLRSGQHYIWIDTEDGHNVEGSEYAWSPPAWLIPGSDFQLEVTGYTQSGNGTAGTSAVFALSNPVDLPTLLFFESVETDMSNWSAGGWGITNLASHSPAHSRTDSPASIYGNDANKILRPPLFDISGRESLALSFWERHELAGGDRGNVLISVDGGPFVVARTFEGLQSTWQPISLDLAPFLGHQSLQIGFQLLSDSAEVADGWYVDDIWLGELRVFSDGFEDGTGCAWTLGPDGASGCVE